MEEYILNEMNDVKVISDKGKIKWFPKHIAEDARLMRDSGYTIVKSPVKLEPVEKKKKE